MSDTFLLTIALGLVATLFGLLISLLSWIGSRLYGKLDEMSKSLNTIKAELHQRITGLDRRVTVIETRLDLKAEQHHE